MKGHGKIQNFAENMTKAQLQQWIASIDRGIKESRYKDLFGKSAEEYLNREREIVMRELNKKNDRNA